MTAGYVIETVTRSPIGEMETKTYELQGGPYFHIAKRLIRTGQAAWDGKTAIRIGPYRFLITQDDIAMRDFVCLLDENPLSRVRAWVHRHDWWVRRLKARVILTFVLWGLGDYCGDGVEPSWSDIRFVRRIARLVR